MKKLIFLLAIIVYSISGWSASSVPDTKINHAWVQGVYWNPSAYPGWGFFVDVQETTFFGAVYGYLGSNSTFITMQGTMTRLDPLRFQGDVYFVTNGGSTVSDVGNFTWDVGYYEATPSATLTITSNILNVSNLLLVRFSYTEIDNIDIITGADWNLVEKIISTFGDSYAVSDKRYTQDGKTFVEVIDNNDQEDIGLAAYYPPDEGEFFAMLVPLDQDTNNFFVFYASDTNMYGRYWLVDDGDTPSGNGYYFHGSIAAMQEANDSAASGVNSPEVSSLEQEHSSAQHKHREESRLEDDAIKKLTYKNSQETLDSMFPKEKVLSVFEELSELHQSKLIQLQ